MSNRNKYKDAMSGVHHSDEAIERIFDMTVDKRNNKNVVLKRIASVTLALAVLIGSGYGLNQITHKQDTALPYDSSQVAAAKPLSVMVAYAGEYKEADEFESKVGSQNKQKVFYAIHFADINDKGAVENLKKLYKNDWAKIQAEAESIAADGYGASVGKSREVLFDSNGKETAVLYEIHGGEIAINLKDYTNVKKLTVNNYSEYGEMYIAYYDSEANNETFDIKQVHGKEIIISGDELRKSQDSKMFESGIEHRVNYGYDLRWKPNYQLYEAIGNDINFDLSEIKDTVTFTVEYNDGTIQSGCVNLYFDRDGYMHFAD